MDQSIATSNTPEQAISERSLHSDPQSGSTTQEMIINDNPMSPIFTHRSERLLQPPKRYSPSLFFMDASEPIMYKEASACADSTDWHLAMESKMNSNRHKQTWGLVELPKESTCSFVQMDLSIERNVQFGQSQV